MMKSRLVVMIMALFIGLNLNASNDPTKGLYPGPTDDKVEKEKEVALMQLIYSALTEVHYNPLSLDDDFSKKAYGLYIERLDMNKRFFIQSDIKALSVYEKEIDDQVKAGTFDLFAAAAPLMDKRTEQAKSYIAEILAEPFNFTEKESFVIDADKVDWAKDTEELKERWRMMLKYDAMARIADKLEEQEKAGFEGEKKSFSELEALVRERILENYDNWYERILKLDRDDRRAIYINSLVNVYGPHTSYFPPEDKENFDISMSGQLEGIGARLTDKDGFITVSEIVPGSPSALQGELEAKDQIIEVTQKGEYPVNIEGAALEDAVKIIRGKKGTTVILTVKKPDGSVKDVEIVRDVVILDETYAKSVVLNDGANKVGYLKLPKFYADFGNGGRSCADDVKKEITKLKEEGIEGLVLDLRDNGGGSLREAIDMGGLFIDAGPIVQVMSKSQAEPIVYKDHDMKIHYDGPLVILINEFSASASEILAAAMQDYGRGVIVGSKSSFGKGTVQRFFGLDDALPADYNHLKPLGAIKITMQKFYQINGGTTQLKGVKPDIVLPDPFMYIEVGEKEQDFALEWDEIKSADYIRWKDAPDLEKLRKNSETRVAANEVFTLIEEQAARLKKRSDETTQSLVLEEYRAQKKVFDEESKKYDEIEKEITKMQLTILQADQKKMEDEKVKQRIEAWHKEVKKDAYIYEALQIIGDMK